MRRLILFIPVLLLCALAPRAGAQTPAEADTLYAHKDWKGAARAYEALAKKEPNKPRYQYRLGVSYGSLEQWPKAIAAYKRAEALGTPPMFARYNLACAFARAGQPDSALVTLTSLVATGYSQAEAIEQDAHGGPFTRSGRAADSPGVRARKSLRSVGNTVKQGRGHPGRTASWPG